MIPSDKKILFVDYISSGHHVVYAMRSVEAMLDRGYEVYFFGDSRICSTLLKRFDSKIYVKERDIKYTNKIVTEFNKLTFFLHCAAFARRMGIKNVHLLYLDRHIFAFALAKLFFFSLRVRATLHWLYFSNSSMTDIRGGIKSSLEVMALKFARFDMIVVHSNTAVDFLKSIQIRKPVAINYPMDVDIVLDPGKTLELRKKYGFPDHAKIILVFGDTRRDKGADIAIEAMKKLPNIYHLLIAGKYTEISNDELLNLVATSDIKERVVLDNRYIPDDDVGSIFDISDFVLLPYREYFSGQSGPLVIGGFLRKNVVGAAVPIIKETIQKYRIGSTFEPESPEDIRRALTEADNTVTSESDWQKFINDHGVENFKNSFGSLYAQKGKIT